MGSKVYFAGTSSGEEQKALARKVAALFQAAGLARCIDKNDLTAVKMHFGERGNDTFVPPKFVKPVVEEIRRSGGRPFLTDTCVLYKSPRNNAVEHLMLAHEHGFTPQNVRAPVVIADGLRGNADREVRIAGKILSKVSIARLAVDAHALIAVTHVTGHAGTGLGGAIKNLGMGLASRKGKLCQHSVSKPHVAAKQCTRCFECAEHCPAGAIVDGGASARIDTALCIGCGECLTACRSDAIRFDWNRTDCDLQQRIAEHALGAVAGKNGKVGCLSFLVAITKDCDCVSKRQAPILPDIGILASHDPVAIDAAALELIAERTGAALADVSYPAIDPWVQIRHGEEIGLGSRAFELVAV